MNVNQQDKSVREEISFRVIGIIRSEHTDETHTPIQPVFAKGAPGKAIIDPLFEDGLQDLEGFSHIFLYYYFHQAPPPQLRVKPYLDNVRRGVFATRSPRRPNPLGMSLVRLVRRERSVLFLEDVDILDGTPLLDIKPFIPRFDALANATGGWSTAVDERTAQIEGRRGYGESDPADGNRHGERG
ncbi:MAG: tRNA (N6-threonylcarbamoyladenosine(37)-N6)-methyltransferase TrmO [Myxococcales bacterium]|nr:tRNA (N6-threonylcarbamoyladenosine(37)-N6)-methyltransferase TrmO [Myxococcales bacterium]